MEQFCEVSATSPESMYSSEDRANVNQGQGMDHLIDKAPHQLECLQ